jgi:ankyrin repeat protein
MKILAVLTLFLAAAPAWAKPSELHHAIVKGDVAQTSRLLDGGAESDRMSEGYFPVELAALHGRADIVGLLLDRGAGIDLKRVPDRTLEGRKYTKREKRGLGVENARPIREMLYREPACYGALKVLVERKIEASLNEEAGSMLPAAWAIGNGNADLLRALLENGADPSGRWGGPGFTLLGQAIVKKDPALVRVLLDHGADPNGVDSHVSPETRDMNYPIIRAIGVDQPAIVRMLLEKRAHGPKAGAMMIRRAAWSGLPEYTAMVVEFDLPFEDKDALIDGVRDPVSVARAMHPTQTELPGLLLAAGVGAGPGTRARRAKARQEWRANEKAILAEESAGDVASRTNEKAIALQRYLAALMLTPQGVEADRRLREKIMRIAGRLDPPVSEAAKRHLVRGQTYVKQAKVDADFPLAAVEFEKATRAAPWWPTPYYNLALVLEKTGDFEGAIHNMRSYLSVARGAEDAEQVKQKIYELEAKRDMAAPR